MKLGAWMALATMLIVGFTLFGFDNIAGSGGINVLTFIGISINEIVTFDIQSASFWIAIGVLLAVGFGGAVVVGLFGRGYDPSLIYAVFLSTVGIVFLISYVQIYSKLTTSMGPEWYWLANIYGLLFVGIIIGYMMALVDYFGGRTN